MCGPGFSVEGVRVEGLEFEIQVKGSALRVLGLAFSVRHLAFSVQG